MYGLRRGFAGSARKHVPTFMAHFAEPGVNVHAEGDIVKYNTPEILEVSSVFRFLPLVKTDGLRQVEQGTS